MGTAWEAAQENRESSRGSVPLTMFYESEILFVVTCLFTPATNFSFYFAINLQYFLIRLLSTFMSSAIAIVFFLSCTYPTETASMRLDCEMFLRINR